MIFCRAFLTCYISPCSDTVLFVQPNCQPAEIPKENKTKHQEWGYAADCRVMGQGRADLSQNLLLLMSWFFEYFYWGALHYAKGSVGFLAGGCDWEWGWDMQCIIETMMMHPLPSLGELALEIDIALFGWMIFSQITSCTELCRKKELFC